MKTEPHQEHRWLQKLVGEWTYESEIDAGNGGTPSKVEGSEIVRPVGELWVVGEGEGEMPDGEHADTVLTLGYDPENGSFVGTWIGSMMTHLWIYRGELDSAGRVLTLEAEGPDMQVEGKSRLYRDVIELVSDDRRILRALVQNEGDWDEMMSVHYRRRK